MLRVSTVYHTQGFRGLKEKTSVMLFDSNMFLVTRSKT